jgi:hypothetical protein
MVCLTVAPAFRFYISRQSASLVTFLGNKHRFGMSQVLVHLYVSSFNSQWPAGLLHPRQ